MAVFMEAVRPPCLRAGKADPPAPEGRTPWFTFVLIWSSGWWGGGDWPQPVLGSDAHLSWRHAHRQPLWASLTAVKLTHTINHRDTNAENTLSNTSCFVQNGELC